MLNFSQSDFGGGMNQLLLDHQIADNEYRLLFNGRSRFGYVEPVKKPVQLTLPVTGARKAQGLYTAGNLILVFVDGYAYYKLTTGTNWNKIANFYMDPNVDNLYACAVPSSGSNTARKLNSNSDFSAGVALSGNSATPSPQVLVVQDGINQPWLIFPDGSSRVSSIYSLWNKDTNREYIPVGKLMCYNNGKLFIVATDGKKIYQSVSGRPLDFVVNIDINGAAGGDADTTSFTVDYNVINHISSMDTGDMFVGTSYNCYKVTADYNITIFGEPTFDIQNIFQAGIVNQFSAVNMGGDTAFIDFEGLKSFNAVKQLRFEGNNSVFSLKVAELFKGIRQSICAAITFDNYAFFALKTTYGYAVLVYDTIKQTFASLDINAANKIRQFATTYTDQEQKLYAITDRAEIYELYSSSEYAIPSLYTKAFIVTDLITEHKTKNLRCIHEYGTVRGTLRATELVDGKVSGTPNRTRVIEKFVSGITYPVIPPVGYNTLVGVNDNTIVFAENVVGFKVSYFISWDNDSRLSALQILSNPVMTDVSTQQQKRIYADAS